MAKPKEKISEHSGLHLWFVELDALDERVQIVTKTRGGIGEARAKAAAVSKGFYDSREIVSIKYEGTINA